MRVSTKFARRCICSTAMLAGTLISHTAVLAIPCNTGVSGTCGLPLLIAGDVDPNWTEVRAAASGVPIATPIGLVFGAAYANRNSGSWLATGPNSGWITPSEPNQPEIGGQYVYHTVFDGIDAFKGRYSTDNELLEVFLNGLLLAGFPTNGPADFGVWTDFNYISTGLVAVGNTLDFVVRNRGQGGIDTNPTVTGFRAEFTVPEPSVLGLCLVGLASLVLLRRRPKLKDDSAPLNHLS